MQHSCPACGAAVDVPTARVVTVYCDYCRQPLAVVPSGVVTRGNIAELVPTSTIVKVGDKATILGQSWEVRGQNEHSRGRV